MKKAWVVAGVCFAVATAALADVSLVERHAVGKLISKAKGPHHPVRATGSATLIDASGLKYFINTNITFSTSSSGSAAMSEASYTHAVAASTLNGGTVSSTLNDMFDGYNELCLNTNNVVATCETGNANFVLYNKNGAPVGSECPDTSGLNRQIIFPVQTSGSIQMQRKVFVPKTDAFARWMNIFTNTGATPQTVTMSIANNLGSDANTVITATSAGGAPPTSTTDATLTWVATFQNYSGTTTSDPRIGHVLQQAGAVTPLAGIHFANGDDNPWWGYTFTLNPGQTKIILNFVTGQPSKAAAAAQAANLASFPTSAQQCMTQTELAETVNFTGALPIAEVPTLGGASLAGLAALLLGVGTIALLRRRG